MLLVDWLSCMLSSSNQSKFSTPAVLRRCSILKLDSVCPVSVQSPPGTASTQHAHVFCRVPVASTAAAATSSYAQATDATSAGQTKLRFYLAGKLVPSTFTIFQVSSCIFIHLPMLRP